MRGLDYYSDTVFEFVPLPSKSSSPKSRGIGSQATILAGGSYAGLVSGLGGAKDIVGSGWSAGLDRLALLLVRAILSAVLLGAKSS